MIRIAAALFALMQSIVPLSAQHRADKVTQSEARVPVPKRMFISGHSLTNQPVPQDLAEIADGFGLPLSWNRQYLEGSSIKQRSRGEDDRLWSGYSRGVDRAGLPVDVLAEFATAAKDPSKKYDVMLITEQHSLLGSLVWNDTVRNLRDFQDRFAAQNPDGRTYFFESWLSLDDKSSPQRWIDYERAAAPVWRCVVDRTNMAIAAEGRKDRLISLPAAAGLARLIELAITHPGLPGISQDSTRATVDRLVQDDVHLTRLGNYYIALLTFGAIFQQSPVGAWRPDDVTVEQAASLQQVAHDFLLKPQAESLSLASCRDYVRELFLWAYLRYAGATQWNKERGFFGLRYLQAKLALQWLWLFSRERPDNPFSDQAYSKS